MHLEYKIDKGLLWRYLLKKAVYDTVFMLIPLFIIFTLIVLGSNLESGILLVSRIKWGILLFLLGIFIFSLLSFNAPLALRFSIGSNSLSKYFSDTRLNFLNKYTFKKMESRAGQKQHDYIYFDNIKSIDIGRFAIVIKSKNHNIFNPNGKIIVPSEIENFKNFKEALLTHPATKNKIKC